MGGGGEGLLGAQLQACAAVWNLQREQAPLRR